jgi:arylsulfatase A-like enzyme
MRKSSVKYALLLFMVMAFCLHGQDSYCQPPASKPNIVFILADDLGWGELGCYGNTFNETPHLDELAFEGMRFTQAYAAAPVCSPTRPSIMTGQYPARVGITDFLAPKSTEYLDPAKFTTLNEVLSNAGYHTGIIGKWHLDAHFKNEKGSPQRFHFDEVIASETKYIADGDYFYPYDKIGTITSGKPHEYLTDRESEEAVKFIQRNKARPFFL